MDGTGVVDPVVFKFEVDEIGIIVFVELVEFVEVDDEEAAIAST